VLAVLDAVGTESTFVYGALDGGALATLFAAVSPYRTRGLIVEECALRFVSAPDYPFGVSPAAWDRLVDAVEAWSIDEFIEFWTAPELPKDDEFHEYFARYAAAGAGPAGFAAVLRRAGRVDLRRVAPCIAVPSLVIAREGDALPVGAVKRLAEAIPGARFVVLPPSPMSSERRWVALAEEIQYFVSGVRTVINAERMVAAVLFVDIVDSTAHLQTRGDARWHRQLDQLDGIVQATSREFGGAVVKSTGDGAVSVFSSPTSAIRAAAAVREGVRELGMDVRAGIHAGEIEVRGADIAGLVVHVAARVQSLAPRGEVLITRTVGDLVGGSSVALTSFGTHDLRGIEVNGNCSSCVSP
jgi:class 3 adenylate cyclase